MGEGEGSGQSSGEGDKSRVLDEKPLRSWRPELNKSPPQSSLFGSSLNGDDNHLGGSENDGSLNRFYPFGNPDGSPPVYAPTPIRSVISVEAMCSGVNGDSEENMRSDRSDNVSAERPVYAPTPIRSVRSFEAMCSGANGDSEENVHSDRSDNVSLKRHRALDETSEPRNNSIVGFDASRKEDGDFETVEYVRLMFDAVRRRLGQLEEAHSCGDKRWDQSANAAMMNNGVRTNMNKRIGMVPGVEIGDIFFYRYEMCLVGLHGQTIAGIDYMTSKDGPLALSVVSSGGYDDGAEDEDVMIYTGQGGVSKNQVVDQKLEKGNLALERSMQQRNEIRVIRGVKDPTNPAAKVYVYDGLYTVHESWTEKGRTGGKIFKFKLVRLANQRSAFSVWKSVEKWKQSRRSGAGLILHDLASGAEKITISVVNDVDNDRRPLDFTYSPSLKYSSLYTSTPLSHGCSCSKCTPGDPNCSCIHQNHDNLPYLGSGILVSRMPMLYECGSTCLCSSKCKNRVSQTGLKFHFEVFKTTDRGWGLRSWDPIRPGEFICEYAGEVVDKLSTRWKNVNDDYIFDTSRHKYNSLKWNYNPALVDEKPTAEPTEDYKIPVPLTISANKTGNVARFMNHSCSPNVFWQPLMQEDNGESFLHIAFFAMKSIPPMTELTFDYGDSQSSSSSTNDSKKKCLCKSVNCRGYFG